MSVGYQRIISGRIALPFHAVDCSDRLNTSWVPGTSFSYWLPETSHERMTVAVVVDGPDPLAGPVVDDAAAAPGVGRQRRGVGRHRTATDESGNPHGPRHPRAAAACGRRATPRPARCRATAPVSRPTTPSTNSPRSVCRSLDRGVGRRVVLTGDRDLGVAGVDQRLLQALDVVAGVADGQAGRARSTQSSAQRLDRVAVSRWRRPPASAAAGATARRCGAGRGRRRRSAGAATDDGVRGRGRRRRPRRGRPAPRPWR